MANLHICTLQLSQSYLYWQMYHKIGIHLSIDNSWYDQKVNIDEIFKPCFQLAIYVTLQNYLIHLSVG